MSANCRKDTYAAEDYFPVAPEFERLGEWVPLIHDWCGGYLGDIELASWSTLRAPEATALAMIAGPLKTMPTSLVRSAMNICKSKPPKPTLPLVSCMPIFWHNTARAQYSLSYGDTHQDGPQRAVPLCSNLLNTVYGFDREFRIASCFDEL